MRSLILLIAAVLTGACASTGATPRPFPTPGARHSAPDPGPAPTGASPVPTPAPTAAAPATGSGPMAYSVTSTALALRGAPYKNGGSDPSGFDCSGFVRYVFSQHGITVPRTVAEQFRAGQKIDETQVEAGDLLFFTTVAPGASHVGIAIGGDEFIHAPSGAGEVKVERLSAPYWATRFVGARRVL